MNRARFHTLLQYFKEDAISQEEWTELRVMIRTGRFDEQLEDDFLILLDQKGKHEQWTTGIEQKIWKGIGAGIDNRSGGFRYRPWMAIAATLLIMLAAGLIFFKSGHLSPVKVNIVDNKHDIAPGGNKAILTLSNGEQILLNDSTTGQLASQAGTSITKVDNGILICKGNSLAGYPESRKAEEIFNTITIPRGGQYQIILPDGTHVWINSASSLKFPAFFKGNTRIVELDGEAYFEVAKNKKMPFIVRTASQEVEVLGTHFNISSYADESATKTTLLEGSVKIVSQNQHVVLIPGQQAQIDKNSPAITVKPVRVDEAVAWKNGYFVFNDEKLESIMHRVSRWYNVDYQFEGKQGELAFLGVVERSKNISSLLKILQSTGNVHFKIEERRIIVMP